MIRSLKKNAIAILLCGMALDTAWAIRGSFGHEQGAAWAGGIGALALILVAKRIDWYQRYLPAALAAAIGWGIGGIISYGLVVGYGRGDDFGNVYYGFSMLLVIGGLFGFIGGGLFGLALSDRPGNKVQWHLYRNEHRAPIRVAAFAALGAGFGFAFGNFLQVMGQAARLDFVNLWNVMEYSIGFFGGCGMAYGTFTAVYPACKNDFPDLNSRVFLSMFENNSSW
jgi:hypothetical protein